jgi:hypothetical protein
MRSSVSARVQTVCGARPLSNLPRPPDPALADSVLLAFAVEARLVIWMIEGGYPDQCIDVATSWAVHFRSLAGCPAIDPCDLAEAEELVLAAWRGEAPPSD